MQDSNGHHIKYKTNFGNLFTYYLMNILCYSIFRHTKLHPRYPCRYFINLSYWLFPKVRTCTRCDHSKPRRFTHPSSINCLYSFNIIKVNRVNPNLYLLTSRSTTGLEDIASCVQSAQGLNSNAIPLVYRQTFSALPNVNYNKNFF